MTIMTVIPIHPQHTNIPGRLASFPDYSGNDTTLLLTVDIPLNYIPAKHLCDNDTYNVIMLTCASFVYIHSMHSYKFQQKPHGLLVPVIVSCIPVSIILLIIYRILL